MGGKKLGCIQGTVRGPKAQGVCTTLYREDYSAGSGLNEPTGPLAVTPNGRAPEWGPVTGHLLVIN